VKWIIAVSLLNHNKLVFEAVFFQCLKIADSDCLNQNRLTVGEFGQE